MATPQLSRNGLRRRAEPTSGIRLAAGRSRERAMRGAPSRGQQREHAQNRSRAAIVFTIAAVSMPCFGIADIAFHAFDSSWNLPSMLLIRAATLVVLAAGTSRLRAPSCSPGELDGWLGTAAVALTSSIVASAIVTGMLDSPYLLGLLLASTVYSFVARPFRRALPSAVLTVLILPLGYAGLAYASPDGDALLAPRELVRLGVVAALHATGVGALVIASHYLWALRREVFESRSIGRYRVTRRIGRGGMGEVWAAWDELLGREVALKVLRTDEHDAVTLARFEREAQATLRLTHPNTVRVFDFGATDDGISFYAMELLEGESLASLLERQGALDAERAVWFALQLARALAEAHARGIVHRDVKPENVFITHAGEEGDHVKLLDFGVARFVGDAGTGTGTGTYTKVADLVDLTHTGMIAGSPQYLAPEVLMGSKATAAADVYALGLVLYRMLAGRMPFVTETGAAFTLARLAREPLPPSALAASVPRALDDLVLRCLALKPEDRPPNGRAVVEALLATRIADHFRPAAARCG